MTRVTVSTPSGGFQQAFGGIADPIAKAATEAIHDAGEFALQRGRADIAGAGFSGAFQKSLTAKYRPANGRPSMNASVLLYSSIPYAVVFEEGYVIRGKPMLWIPLSGVRVGGKQARLGGKRQNVTDKLFSINRPGKRPLLARKGADGKAQIMFVGVDAVKIRKRLHLHDAFDAAQEALPRFFESRLKVD